MMNYRECFITVRVALTERDITDSGTPRSFMVAAHRQSEIVQHTLVKHAHLNDVMVTAVEIR
jgi:hypothetical protein